MTSNKCIGAGYELFSVCEMVHDESWAIMGVVLGDCSIGTLPAEKSVVHAGNPCRRNWWKLGLGNSGTILPVLKIRYRSGVAHLCHRRKSFKARDSQSGGQP